MLDPVLVKQAASVWGADLQSILDRDGRDILANATGPFNRIEIKTFLNVASHHAADIIQMVIQVVDKRVGDQTVTQILASQPALGSQTLSSILAGILEQSIKEDRAP